jgi:hypothetical protein
VVIGTHPLDFHPDHATVGRAIEKFAYASSTPMDVLFFVVHCRRSPDPDSFKPDSPLSTPLRIHDDLSTWEVLPLPSDTEDEKEQAILEYHSQLCRKAPLKRGLLVSFIRTNELFAVRHYPLAP